ncbi:hypothetical protein SSX86_022354 [Deinandra increscens subsp. villosa]|uniref:EngB-type G domain-containing protein n=1 Tax=Deinandra increscens subsp. villosa TaxID=3103831 RepID=A0AAP0CQG4_9ASTR
MNQETRSKHSSLKKRAKVAIGRSDGSFRDRFKTLDSKKKVNLRTAKINTNRRVKNDDIASNVEDGFYKRRNDSGRNDENVSNLRGRRTESDDSRGRGSKLNYRGRNETSDFGGKKKRIYADDGGSKLRNNVSDSKSKVFDKRESSQDGGDDWRMKRENSENRSGFLRRNGDAKYVSKNRVFDKRESQDGGGDPRTKRENSENRSGFLRKNGDAKYVSKHRVFDKRESQDGGGDGRTKRENSENRSGFLRKNGDAKYENSKQTRGPVEEHKFGVKKLKVKKNVSDDSLEMFDRPRRKRRLFRVEYPHDTANKRFDDSLPTIDNTTEQKKDSDTEENTEMSQNAQFRAIPLNPSIISFVNENLLGRRREIEFKKAGYDIELPSPLDNIPFSTSSERERIEEPVFRNKLTFFAAAKVSSSFPPPDLPEIAFAGRSNVGKSSLLNSLTRQWGVVRTSDKPGLTQTINFFNLGSKLCLVDLPGYGFAYAKEEVKESWEELVKEYVSTREGLKRVCLLIDTKWGMKPRDHELIDLMERSKTKYQIVLTKTDLAFPVDVARRAMQIEENLRTKKSALQPLMMVSSKTGAGIRTLRTVLSNVSRFARL